MRMIKLGQQPAGLYLSKDRAAYWDGCNDDGERVSSGVYLYTLQTGDIIIATRKMVIAK